jgi:hypothetical protein
MAAKLPSKTVRFRRLLEAGFLPEELPPPFVSTDLGRWREYLGKEWPKDLSGFPKTTYE